ncbi:MAG: CRTAC1 family protein [Acidobacteria bacterium]|nr:CRTAC1 family protein [Acidobacteriota bacterium]
MGGSVFRFLLLLTALEAAAAPPPIRFEEIAAQSGLRFELQNGEAGGFHQIELTLGGVAAFDYNNDGCTDIFFTNGAAIPSLRKTSPKFSNRLFRNNCNLTFTDVTAETDLAGEGYAMAVATADYDNDGFADLFVAGVKGNTLYRNLGNGRFAAAPLPLPDAPKWAVSAGWFDYDNDGWLDLFVANYVVWDAATEPRCGTPERQYYCHPNAYQGLPNQLFHNNHDGTFSDVSAASGIGRQIGKGMGVSFADFDDDGLTDIFIANDSVRGILFRNEGQGKFTEIGLEAGVALRDDGYAIAGMGADFRDLDNDGKPDLLVSGIVNDSFLLFRNLGGRKGFEDYAQRTGLLMSTRQLTGWSLGMFDFDNDGWKDLFFALGHLMQLDRYLGRQSALPNRVYRNIAGQRLEDVSSTAGPAFQVAAAHRGAAFADFDNDGRIDVVVTAVNGPAKLFRNVSAGPAHWLALRLRGTRSNRQGLGAKVHVRLPDGRHLYNHATTAVGYASSSEPLVRFGLGTNRAAAEIEIQWPSGRLQKLSSVAADRVLDVTEDGEP